MTGLFDRRSDPLIRLRHLLPAAAGRRISTKPMRIALANIVNID